MRFGCCVTFCLVKSGPCANAKISVISTVVSILNLKSGRLRHYLPALILLLLALFFVAVPLLAVFLVVGALLTFAFGYAFIIFSLHKAQDRMEHGQSISLGEEFEGMQDPNFRNVSVHIFRRGKIFRNLN